MNNWALIAIILLISLCESAGQSCLKKLFVNPDEKYLYFVAILFYSIVCYLLIMSYRYKGMGLVNILWSGMSILVICSVGITFFGEKITFMDKIGIGLIVAGIACVLWEGGH